MDKKRRRRDMKRRRKRRRKKRREAIGKEEGKMRTPFPVRTHTHTHTTNARTHTHTTRARAHTQCHTPVPVLYRHPCLYSRRRKQSRTGKDKDTQTWKEMDEVE